jgi:hypothetical protein
MYLHIYISVNSGRRTSTAVTKNGVTAQSADHSTIHSNTDSSNSSSVESDSAQQHTDATLHAAADTAAVSDTVQSMSLQQQQQQQLQQQQEQQQEMVMATPSDPAADNLFRVFLVFGEMRSNGVKPDNAGIFTHYVVLILPRTATIIVCYFIR